MNGLLKEFVTMRQNLHQNLISDPTDTKKNKPEKNEDVKPTDITVQTIIDKKPSNKKVLNYFKKKYSVF
jgi:hypothetical protein